MRALLRLLKVCLGRETQGDLQSKTVLKGWPCVRFSSLSKQPCSFPGALTTFSWTGFVLCPSRCSDFNPAGPRSLSGVGLCFFGCRNDTASQKSATSGVV